MTTSWSVGDVAPGMLRFLIEIGGTSRYSPRFTLDVFQRSPKDGSEFGLVRIPLTVR